MYGSNKSYGFGFKGQRSMLRLGLTAIRHGFEFYECLLVINATEAEAPHHIELIG